MSTESKLKEAMIYLERERNTAELGLAIAGQFAGKGDKTTDAFHSGFVAMEQLTSNALQILRGEVDSEGNKVYDND